MHHIKRLIDSIDATIIELLLVTSTINSTLFIHTQKYMGGRGRQRELRDKGSDPETSYIRYVKLNLPEEFEANWEQSYSLVRV